MEKVGERENFKVQQDKKKTISAKPSKMVTLIQ